jgi:hypothetical protein
MANSGELDQDEILSRFEMIGRLLTETIQEKRDQR